MQLLDIPYMHAKVRKEFVGADEDVECYIFALTVILNRPLLFTAHLVNGAVYSRLPLDAFYSFRDERVDEHHGCWGALGNKAYVVAHKYLKDYEVETRHGKGRYLYTIDFYDGGFSEDPTQHKTANVLELHTGNFVALPNNECVFKDAHFFDPLEPTILKRNETYFIDRGFS